MPPPLLPPQLLPLSLLLPQHLLQPLVLAMPVDSISVQHVEGAGCYGHNGADDAACDAALLARAVPGRAVQLQWTREDELGCAPFGAAMAVELRASVSTDGLVTDWQGGPAHMGGRIVAAANAEIHAEALALLNG